MSDMSYKNYTNLFVYSGANKAGMGQIDKDKQAQIIYEMSKNSAYFKKAAKLDEVTDEKVKLIQVSIDSISPHQETKLLDLLSQKSVELEKRRSFDRICCVLDMDMFFAAVEIRDQPHLKDLPVAVGGDMMISTANYVARKYGVRAAMPGFVAKKLCPQLVYVNCNFSKYEKVAEQIRSIIGEYDSSYRSHSLDEVYFDLTKASKKRLCDTQGENKLDGIKQKSNGEISSEVVHSSDEVEQFVEDHNSSTINDAIDYDIMDLRKMACVILAEIRHRIQETTNGLTASAGIANNFFLAKICADINKPDGQYELGPTRDSVISFVTSLSTRKVGGIGKVTEKILSKLGMDTLGQVRDSMHKVLHSFSPISSEFLMRVSLGIAEEEGIVSNTIVPPGAVTRKSIGCERTFSAKGISETSELLDKLAYICGQVSKDMAGEDLWGRTVTLKLKTVTFDLLTRSISGKQFVQSAQDIERLARQLLDQLLPVNIRLMGVSVSKFKNAFDPSEAENRGQKNVLQFFQQLVPDTSLSKAETQGVATLGDDDHALDSRDTSMDGDGFPAYDPLLYGDGEDTTCDTWDHSYSNSHTKESSSNKRQEPNEEALIVNSQSLFEAVVNSSQSDLLSYSQQQRDEKELGKVVVEKTVPCVEVTDSASIVTTRFSSNSSRSNNLSEKLVYACPICEAEVYGTLVALNTHIDGCLSESSSTNGKSSISNYFQIRDSSSVVDLCIENNAHDRLSGPFGLMQPNKRVKTEKVKCGDITRFFNK